MGPWRTEDFESVGWHDVHVHGFRLDSFEADEAIADLILDIDYILEWEDSDKPFCFTVCRAELRFHKIFGIKKLLDYATPTAGICPVSIDHIKGDPFKRSTGSLSYQWQIAVNWPVGYIDFDSPGFTQILVGKPLRQSCQWLSTEQRSDGYIAG